MVGTGALCLVREAIVRSLRGIADGARSRAGSGGAASLGRPRARRSRPAGLGKGFAGFRANSELFPDAQCTPFYSGGSVGSPAGGGALARPRQPSRPSSAHHRESA